MAMEIDESKQSSSGLEFKLHPLVLINVSDHFTRLKANGVDGAPAPTVMGCLLGSQDGRTVDISNSFEIKCDESPENGSFQIDNAFLLKKQEQCEYRLQDSAQAAAAQVGDSKHMSGAARQLAAVICDFIDDGTQQVTDRLLVLLDPLG
eukprot:gene6237-6474_t